MVAPAPPRVRRLSAGDLPFVRALSREAFADFSRDPVPSTMSMVARHTAFVAEREGAAIGLSVVRLVSEQGSRERWAELLAIAVLEHERGRGVGRALLRHTERAARNAGARWISLHTADANLAALELFTKTGYELERRHPRYYLDVFDACELRKAL